MIYYSDKNLFSSSKLWEYDEEGQKFFLAYLMKSEEWHIENNTIVFKDIWVDDNLDTISDIFLALIVKEPSFETSAGIL